MGANPALNLTDPAKFLVKFLHRVADAVNSSSTVRRRASSS